MVGFSNIPEASLCLGPGIKAGSSLLFSPSPHLEREGGREPRWRPGSGCHRELSPGSSSVEAGGQGERLGEPEAGQSRAGGSLQDCEKERGAV